MDPGWGIESDPGRWHLMKERFTISAVFILFVVVFCMVALRLYVRWYVLSQLERRGILGNVLFYGDNDHPSAAVYRGLEPEVLNSLPVFSYSAAEQPTQECTVCLSEYEENDAVRLLPKCNHSFHVDCIDIWFHSHSTCPICRSKVEAVANVVKPASTGVEMTVEVSRSEPGSSSRGIGPGNNESEGANMTLSPSIRAELDSELTQCSPPRLSSFKRLLSMSRKPPIDGGGAMPPGTSRGPTKLDLEGGPSASFETR
ncbi:hypothetical protein BUALT_Bualt12G0118300 [Buddleja alternifolia]|uniref:RING-type E3 ubiquitin transferase n=1 Tax=Buddleja alternifolia TaxID=168488 RepID=A0AAV6X189_9LAMI|nr:hypothetical protein BUALT_Bualt12G0118300 [Buddleja alternifolia]